MTVKFDTTIDIIGSGYQDMGIVGNLQDGKIVQWKVIGKNFGLNTHMPLWRGVHFNLFNPKTIVRINNVADKSIRTIRLQVTAPWMKPREFYHYYKPSDDGFSILAEETYRLM